MTDAGKIPTTFRAGVGVVLVNAASEVLVLERADRRDAWQFPQGGIEGNESPLAAAYRELREETGLTQFKMTLLAEYPQWLVYQLPEELRSPKTGWGQVQRWFFMRGPEDSDRLRARIPSSPEFERARWTSFGEAVKHAAPFRRELYEQLRQFSASRLDFAEAPPASR